MSPQSAIRYSYTYANFSADNAQASTNVLKNNPFNFKNTYNEFAVGIEFNFFKYNLNQFRFMHTPYVFLNIAALAIKFHQIVLRQILRTLPNLRVFHSLLE